MGKPRWRAWWVYILASRKHGTLYVGMTTDLVLRLEQHRRGTPGSFTQKYKVFRLVYTEEYATWADARQREHMLKRWARAWKVQLIESVNPDWQDLAVYLPASYR